MTENLLCQCDGPGFCTRHKMRKGERLHALCKGLVPESQNQCGAMYWNAWERGKAQAGVEQSAPQLVKSFCEGETQLARGCKGCGSNGTPLPPAYSSGLGNRLKDVIAREYPDAATCGTCAALMLKMNDQSRAEAAADIENIVEDIVSRAPEQAPKLWQKIAVMADEATGFGETRRRVRSWVEEAISLPPLGDDPSLTLLMHVWPNGDGWQDHAEKLRPILHKFDRKILGIATDKQTATVQEVTDYFGDGWEIVTVENDRSRKGMREVATYQQMLPTLSKDRNAVTFCAHAKGAQSHTAGSESVEWWTDAMYETILFNIDGVVDEIRKGASVVGSFRRHGNYLQARFKWHYSGAVYAFRNYAALAGRMPLYRPKWWGTESWPGDWFPVEESACIFGDNAGDLYAVSQQPREALDEWKEQRANSTR